MEYKKSYKGFMIWVIVFKDKSWSISKGEIKCHY